MINVEEMKQDLCSYISDASKDAWGFRSRLDYSQYTVVQLEMIADEWTVRVQEAIDEENRWHLARQRQLEELIERTIEMGAGDRITAMRWILDGEADEWGFYGWDDIEYRFGVIYGLLENEFSEVIDLVAINRVAA